MPVEVISTITSVGSWIVGSGTVSTRTSRRPCQVSALMAFPPHSPEPGSAMSRCMPPLTESGSTLAASPWALVPTPPATIFLSPFHQRLEALLRDLRRAVLARRADLRVVHVGAVEEVGLGRAGHQRGDRDPAVLAAPPATPRRTTGRTTSTRCRRPGSRPGIVEAIDEVNSTRPSSRAAMSRSTSLASRTVELMLVSMISCSSAMSVSTNAPPCPTPAFSAAAASGRPVAPDGGPEGVDPVGATQVGLHLLHGRPGGAQLLRGGGNPRVLRVHDEVEAVVGELPRELVADAAGGTGDEGEGPAVGHAGRHTRRPIGRIPSGSTG